MCGRHIGGGRGLFAAVLPTLMAEAMLPAALVLAVSYLEY